MELEESDEDVAKGNCENRNGNQDNSSRVRDENGNGNGNGNVHENGLIDERDREGISLLRIIFPDAEEKELKKMHFERITSPAKLDKPTSTSTYTNTNTNRGARVINNGSRKDEAGKDIVSVETFNPSMSQEKETKATETSMVSKDVNKKPAPTKSKTVRKPIRMREIMTLSDDFLRIPQHQALKLLNKRSGRMQWNVTANLERQVIQAHRNNSIMNNDYDDEIKNILGDEDYVGTRTQSMLRSAVLTRESHTSGLGMQLCEWDGFIYINSLTCRPMNVRTAAKNRDRDEFANRITDEESYQVAVQSGIDWDEFGPAFKAGLKPGDQILGVSGIPFLRQKGSTYGASSLLAHAANIIRGRDPIILHILRVPGRLPVDRRQTKGHSHAVAKKVHDTQQHNHSPARFSVNGSTRSGGQSDSDSWTTHSNISITEKDGWQMLDDHHVQSSPMRNHRYRRSYPYRRQDSNQIHPLVQQFGKKGLTKSKKEQLGVTRELLQSTSRASMWHENTHLSLALLCDEDFSLLRQGLSSADVAFIRQGLSVHIVNTFADRDRLAYTIWIFDVQSGTEWYMPRYFHDFQELRLATSRLKKVIEKLPFPNESWFGEDESSLTQMVKDVRCRQLEEFLRGLCNLVYTEGVDESTIEVALFLQTFVGCEKISEPHKYDEKSGVRRIDNSEEELRMAIKLYTYRLFLLSTFKKLHLNFIEDVKRRAVLIEEKKTVSMGSNLVEKEKIIIELTTIKHVFANIWDIIYRGCLQDINAICSCSEFCQLTGNLTPENRAVYIEKMFREAVREQLEINVYVPLRSIISRLLVHGWRYDDKSIAFKIRILKEKSQSFFNIKLEHQSESGWQSVIDILTEGVGRSTLPCNKLKAIVDAGKEVGRLSEVEHPGAFSDTSIGADDFLPIFIFCIINAEIDRPCALCKLKVCIYL